MSVAVLLIHHWHRHRTALLVLAAVMALFEWIFTQLAPAPEEAVRVRALLDMFPPPVVALIPQELLQNITARGFVGFGYQHPFAILMMSIWVVRVGAGALAGEIGLGTMDLLAARPVSRRSFVLAALVSVVAGLTLMIGAAWTGTAAGLLGRSLDDARPADYLGVAATAWLLFASFGSLAVLISATRRVAGDAIALSSSLLAGSFLLDYLARVWPPVTPFGKLSLFLYFKPNAILLGGLDAADAAVPAAVALLGLAVALAVFQRRDL